MHRDWHRVTTMHRIPISVLGALAVAGAVAQSTLPLPEPDTASAVQGLFEPNPRPPEQLIDGVGVVSGGADELQAEAMRAMARDYPLHLVFSGRGGEYVVPRNLQVIRSNGTSFDIPDAGPHVLLRLEPGRYRMVADFEHGRMTRDVLVGRKHAQEAWVVPATRYN